MYVDVHLISELYGNMVVLSGKFNGESSVEIPADAFKYSVMKLDVSYINSYYVAFQYEYFLYMEAFLIKTRNYLY